MIKFLIGAIFGAFLVVVQNQMSGKLSNKESLAVVALVVIFLGLLWFFSALIVLE